jgi:hypothetical protein
MTTLDLILPIVEKKELTPGTAYVVFLCGCVIPQDDLKKKVFRTNNGKSRAVCPEHPSFKNQYMGRYRICERCGFEEATRKGRGFETNVCKTCNTAEWDLFKIESRKDQNADKEALRNAIRVDAPIKRKRRTKYYQNGKVIKDPEEPYTDPLCGNRDDCLDAAGYEADTYIHCTGCPNQKNWIDI